MSKKMPPEVRNDPTLSYFWRRLYRYDQNVLLIICGGTGSCKSGSGITIGTLMDRGENGECRFNINRIVFKAQDFVKLVRSKIPKGSVLIWDEIGVEHDARNYFSMKNKLVKYVMQTFRYRNFMLIMTVPDLKSIDIGTRRLLHCYLEMQGPLPSKKYASGQIRFVQINPRTGKEYYKKPRYVENGVKKTLPFYYVQRPPLELENAYKAKKEKVTAKWYADFEDQMNYMESVMGMKKEEKKKAIEKISDLADKVLDAPSLCYDSKLKKFTGGLIKSHFEDLGQMIGIHRSFSIAGILNRKLKENEISAP